MTVMLSRLLRRNETLVGLIIVLFAVFTGLSDPSFFTIANLFDLLRASIVMGIFAIGVLVVLISGGIDVSFTAVAAFSMYSTTLFLTSGDVQLHWAVIFLISAAIGFALGMVNAIFIGIFRLPTLIVTLGTLSLFRGLLLTFVGTDLITNLPRSLRSFSRADLFEVISPDRVIYSLPVAFVFLVGVVVITWFILYRTMLGRAIFALGGSAVAAERSGFNLRRLQFFIYGYVAALAGLAGIIHASMSRVANPFDLVGLELNVIAAVVLGGARLTGGTGTITGTLLGVALIVVINNSLIVLGIPSYWQRVVIGLLILLGTGLPAYQALRGQRQLYSKQAS
jgi:simple sugar transport system permease protein